MNENLNLEESGQIKQNWLSTSLEIVFDILLMGLPIAIMTMLTLQLFSKSGTKDFAIVELCFLGSSLLMLILVIEKNFHLNLLINNYNSRYFIVYKHPSGFFLWLLSILCYIIIFSMFMSMFVGYLYIWVFKISYISAFAGYYFALSVIGIRLIEKQKD